MADAMASRRHDTEVTDRPARSKADGPGTAEHSRRQSRQRQQIMALSHQPMGHPAHRSPPRFTHHPRRRRNPRPNPPDPTPGLLQPAMDTGGGGRQPAPPPGKPGRIRHRHCRRAGLHPPGHRRRRLHRRRRPPGRHCRGRGQPDLHTSAAGLRELRHPQRYTPAPAPHLDVLTAAYDHAIQATRHTTALRDHLAAAIRAPSSILASRRRASATVNDRHPTRRPLPQTYTVTARSVPGPAEQALLDLQIRDPALLLRAAVIDKAAHDLLIGATASARRRGTALKSSRPSQGVR